MKLILDTQIFIWWDSAPERLSNSVIQLCEDPTNTLVLSVTSVWEMQIKSQLGKLTLDRSLALIIDEHMQTNGLELLPIELPHVVTLEQLPLHHKDPFDRIIVAQAIYEKLTVLGVDSQFAQYSVDVLGRTA